MSKDKRIDRKIELMQFLGATHSIFNYQYSDFDDQLDQKMSFIVTVT